MGTLTFKNPLTPSPPPPLPPTPSPPSPNHFLPTDLFRSEAITRKKPQPRKAVQQVGGSQRLEILSNQLEVPQEAGAIVVEPMTENGRADVVGHADGDRFEQVGWLTLAVGHDLDELGDLRLDVVRELMPAHPQRPEYLYGDLALLFPRWSRVEHDAFRVEKTTRQQLGFVIIR